MAQVERRQQLFHAFATQDGHPKGLPGETYNVHPTGGRRTWNPAPPEDTSFADRTANFLSAVFAAHTCSNGSVLFRRPFLLDMKLRNQKCVGVPISTKFDSYLALRRAIEEDEARRQADEEDDTLTDTEVITAVLRELELLGDAAVSKKRRRASSPPPPPGQTANLPHPPPPPAPAAPPTGHHSSSPAAPPAQPPNLPLPPSLAPPPPQPATRRHLSPQIVPPANTANGRLTAPTPNAVTSSEVHKSSCRAAKPPLPNSTTTTTPTTSVPLGTSPYNANASSTGAARLHAQQTVHPTDTITTSEVRKSSRLAAKPRPTLSVSPQPTATTPTTSGEVPTPSRQATHTSSTGVDTLRTEQDPRNKRRCLLRQQAKAANPLEPSLEHTMKLISNAKDDKAKISVKAETFPAAGGGYGALPDRKKTRVLESVAKLQKLRFKKIEWDGKTPTAIVDDNDKVIVMLAGSPDDASWKESCEHVFRLLVEKRAELPAEERYCEHVRGSFPAINVGVTHGKGSQQPHTLNHGTRVRRVVYEIIEDPEMRRLATFQSAAFRTWAPKLYRYYEGYMDQLWTNEELNKEEPLRRNFDRSVFPCVALNFGPHVCTRRHRDTKNLPFGWCAITALGKFDPTKGGHLVLPDLKLYIEFPPGSTVFIPSATLIHANTPVKKTESRVSFTQFCAGDIFRYIDCGFMTEKRLAASDPVKYAEHLKTKTTRWMEGLGLYSKFSELKADNKRDLMGDVYESDESEDTSGDSE